MLPASPFAAWHGHCPEEGRGKTTPRREVGKMGYILFAITYIVLAVAAAAKPRAGHA